MLMLDFIKYIDKLIDQATTQEILRPFISFELVNELLKNSRIVGGSGRKLLAI